MQKADGQSVKALFNFARCGECGLGFCFWQRRSWPRKTLLRTKRCVCSAANWAATRYTKLCRSVVSRAIRSPTDGELLSKIRRVAASANWKLPMAKLIPTTKQTATQQVPLAKQRSMSHG